MNLAYIIPRLLRHFMPDGLSRFLLRRNLVIHPGLETRAPQDAANRYLQALKQSGIVTTGKRLLVFGYGGSFELACLMLKNGAEHVFLCDKAALRDEARNARLLPDFEAYLTRENGATRPRPEVISLLQGDIRQMAENFTGTPVDIVLSTSVFEHLDDVEGITRALAGLTAPGGTHLHYIDLRDHFFKYPFEMLTFSESVWRGWLNPTSNLNRRRVESYRNTFECYFRRVTVEVMERDLSGFALARSRVRPEFISGDDNMDAVAQICIIASQPILQSPAQPLRSSN